MNRPRVRIAMLVGGFVLLTLLIIMLAFNLMIERRMFRSADNSLRASILPDTAEEPDSLLYSPEIIFIYDDKDSKWAKQEINTKKKESIKKWSSNREKNKTEKAAIDGNTYYVLRTDTLGFNIVSTTVSSAVSEKDSPDPKDLLDGDDISMIMLFGNENDAYRNIKELVAYIDITGEVEMIRHINIVFIVSALVMCILGSTIGFNIGRKLEQNQLAQKQFFENTSHELKTPLTSIRGYAEGIEKGIITDNKKTGRCIAEQTEKMSSLIEEILCFAKLESGSVRLQRENIDLPDFLQDCLMPFEGTVMNKGLDVTLDLSPMTVSADPDKLDHAVSNLITNSLKYALSRIEISCGGNCFRIQNDCEELTDDTLEHLFERFYTGRDGNTGIGLALAKDIILLHGWKITAERRNGGICFTVNCT